MSDYSDTLPVPRRLVRINSETENALEQFAAESQQVIEDFRVQQLADRKAKEQQLTSSPPPQGDFEPTLVVTVTSAEHGDEVDSLKGEAGLPKALFGNVFVGHTATDMDSIASAIGAAELFDGIAARASDINTETEFALKHWDLKVPPPFLEVGLGKDVCLVDHNQKSQMAEGVDMKRITGCIDHHALQSGTIVTDLPIYVKIRAWGSACTIVADMFVRRKKRIKPQTAGILLSGILSDTLNLHSPTTTDADRRMLAVLARIARVEDINSLAQQMFKAKSRTLASLSAHGLLKGDLKRFNFAKEGKLYKLAFGVVETIRPVEVLDKMDQLFVELRGLKKEDGLDFAFLAVVDILKGGSTLLMAGQSELALGKLAYPNNTFVEDGNKFFAELPGICSRKLQFIPPLSEVLQGDWVPPAELLNIDSEAIAGETFGKVVLECTEHGCIVKRRPTSFKQIATNVVHAQTLIGNASDHSSGCSHHHGHSGHAQDVDMDPAEAKKQAAETAALYSHPVLMATMQDVLDDAHSNDPDSFVQRYSAALAAKLQTSA